MTNIIIMTNIINEFQDTINKCITDNTPMNAIIFIDYINKINKHQKNEYMKNYIVDKPTLICDCGGHYKKHQYHIHRKSHRHIKYFTITENKEN
jgi:hypothetical protein